MNNSLSSIEKEYINRFNHVVGVDEVGRGALFGPIVACSVLLDDNFMSLDLDKIRDSKKLSEKKRNNIVEDIINKNCKFGLGFVNNRDIDSINIRNATLLAMKNSIENIGINIDAALVDGKDKILDVDFYQNTVVQGDDKCKVIGLSSILAKFIRDFIIRKYDRVHPYYKLFNNVGYGTEEHIENIGRFGKSLFHRKSFKINLIDT